MTRMPSPQPTSKPDGAGLRAQWLTLELGVADHLRRLENIAVSAPHGRHGRRALILEAAHTLFPEADVENLPRLARQELAAGMTGPLRQKIAATDADEDALNPLRDQLVAKISGYKPEQEAAIVIADQVHLRRLVRGHVPTIIALDCLGWYGSYRHPSDPNAEAIAVLAELNRAWHRRPEHRAQLHQRIMGIAHDVVGRSPTTLIDDDV